MTSNEAIAQLEAAAAQAHKAAHTIDNLLAAHDYQDVAALSVRAAKLLLEAAIAFMRNDDVTAFAGLESSGDLVDALYDIVDGELDDED